MIGDVLFGAEHASSRSEETGPDLAPRLAELRLLPGCPTGSDAAILAMSNPPGHTACPNPFIDEWLQQEQGVGDRPDPGPFSTDATAGKTTLVYKAHSYPTKVPHEAIMRLLLHYTRPGDVVLDGFCGTGMTGVAAQMCGAPSAQLRSDIEGEMGSVEWGTRRAVLQDLLPSATFIAAGLNLPVDADAFDRVSAALLRRFDSEWGWMYETTVTDGAHSFAAAIDYTVWSEVMSCPQCASEVVFYDVAFNPKSGAIAEGFPCANCGAPVSKSSLKKRLTKVRTLSGDVIDRTDFRPVAIHWRLGKARGVKVVDDNDRDVLRRIASAAVPTFPTTPLPYMHMTHERSPTAKNGFARLDALWPDRSLAALAVLWNWVGEEADPALRRALLFWIEQGLWGLSWMNRYQWERPSDLAPLWGKTTAYFGPTLSTSPL